MRNIILLPFAVLSLGQASFAQTRQSTCIWGEDFEQGIPADWSTNQVERQSPSGEGLGEFVPAFRSGSAQEANAGGFFPVPDAQLGNRFAMANDDAAPCNCDLDSAVLATPSIDLSELFNIALDLRVFHTQALGGGEARIEFSADGGEWLPFEVIPAGPGWQRLTYNISILGGISDLRLRFRWSDDGNWASGFALDDLCIRECLSHDLAITGARAGDGSVSPFAGNTLSLGYTELALEQSRPMAVSVDLHNLGLARLYNVSVSVMANQNGVDHGPYLAAPIDSINSGDRMTVVVATDWTPDALGQVSYTATAASPTGEDDPADNSSAATVRITGPGWDDGYSAMALDAGTAQGIQRTEQNFIAAVRMEMANAGSHARGMSALLDPASQIGEVVRAILMDASFNLIDTSLRHVITATDLEAAGSGIPLYLPYVDSPILPAADCFVGLQRLSGTGAVGVATRGNCQAGAAAWMQGFTFDITWLGAVPVVRLHLSDYGVGQSDRSLPCVTIRVNPQPLSDEGWAIIQPWHGGAARMALYDLNGRVVQELGPVSSASFAQRVPLNVSSLAPGWYLFRIAGEGFISQQPVLVAR